MESTNQFKVGNLYKTFYYKTLYNFFYDEDSMFKDEIGYIENNTIFVLLEIDDFRDGYMKILATDGLIGWIQYSELNFSELDFIEVTSSS